MHVISHNEEELNFVDLPEKLKNKKAIINVRNKDNECLKWLIRAALYPAQNGNKSNRPSSS